MLIEPVVVCTPLHIALNNNNSTLVFDFHLNVSVFYKLFSDNRRMVRRALLP